MKMSGMTIRIETYVEVLPPEKGGQITDSLSQLTQLQLNNSHQAYCTSGWAVP